MRTVQLNTGHAIPSVGFGTFLIKPEQTTKAVSNAPEARLQVSLPSAACRVYRHGQT